MPSKATYAPGEPVWFDLSTPDVQASAAFYGALLGWTAEPASEQHGGYTNVQIDGVRVGGLLPTMSPEQPTTWTVYLCTDDAEASAARVTEAGGAVLVPPMPVDALGTMAVFHDPAGGVFGVWQPGEHAGSGRVREPGAPTWTELATAEPRSITGFYAQVTGAEVRTSEAYVELLVGGEAVAGIADTAQGTSGWLPYFGAVDPAEKTVRAVELGASVVLPHTSFPGGSCSIVRDPQGAVFGLVTP